MTSFSSIGSEIYPIRLQNSLRDLVASRRILESIARILRGNTEFKSCLNASSIHENSFIKVPVPVELPDQQRLRIHFWLSSSDEQNIHDHRFDFASAVMSGCIENIIWHPDPTGNEFYGFRYYNDKSGRRLEPQTGCALRPSSRSHYRTGNSYSVHRDTLHTINHSKDAVTIILEDRTQLKPYANVYSRINRAVGHTPADTVSEDLLREKLLEFCLQNAVAN